MTNNYYFSTDEGITEYPYNQWFYFANESDLMDHFQALYKCTANEIEFSYPFQQGEMFKKHNGSIDQAFCKNHNAQVAGDLGDGDLNELYANFHSELER